MQEDTYRPILKGLSDGPKTARELSATPEVRDLGWAKIQQALSILVGIGHLQPALPAKDDSRRSKTTKAFNQAVMTRARDHGELQFLSSPISGGGHSVGRFQQLFSLSIAEGGKTPDAWAAFVWKLIAAQGQRLLKGDRVVETEEENLAELKIQAEEFASKQLPVLKSLQIL